MNGAGPSNRPAKRQKTNNDLNNRLMGKVNRAEGMNQEWGKARYHVPHEWVYNFQHIKKPGGGTRRDVKLWPHPRPEGSDYKKLIPITSPAKLQNYMTLARRNKRPEANSYNAYLARSAGATRSGPPVQRNLNRTRLGGNNGVLALAAPPRINSGRNGGNQNNSGRNGGNQSSALVTSLANKSGRNGNNKNKLSNQGGRRSSGNNARSVHSSETGDGGDGVCAICGEPGFLIICDGCDEGFHMTCVDPPLTSVPEGDWFCPNCAEDTYSGVPARSRNGSGTNNSFFEHEGEFNKPKLLAEVNRALWNENKSELPSGFGAAEEGLRRKRQAQIAQLREEFRSTPSVAQKLTILSSLRPLGNKIENLLQDPSLTNKNRKKFIPNAGVVVTTRGSNRLRSWLENSVAAQKADAAAQATQSRRRITPIPITNQNRAQNNRKGKRKLNNT